VYKQLTVKQITERIEIQKATEDRWPTRLIFAHTLDSYKELVAALRNVCDVSVSLADEKFTTGDDILPNFNRLTKFFGEHEGKAILVTDISEYLRICISKETSNDGGFKGIWERVGAVTSKTKIIIPLFNCETLFDRVIPTINERQADNIWSLARQSGNAEFSLSLYSPDFENSLTADATGFRNWLLSWSYFWTEKTACSVVTKLNRYAEEQYGDVSLKIVNDPFLYATELASDGYHLKKEWFDDWVFIAGKLNQGEAFAELIKRELRITDFDFLMLASRWHSLSEIERQYIWIWYRLYPYESYADYVITSTDNALDIPGNIRDKILEIANPSMAWIKERGEILKRLPAAKIDGAFLTRLSKLPIERQIELLNFVSFEEQTYAFELIGKMLANGADLDEALKLFESRFPLINMYFTEIITDDELRSYFNWYKSNKFKNHAMNFDAPYIDIEIYDGRHKILKKHDNADTFFLWVDGLGLEWSALLCHLIKEKTDAANIVLNAGRALLPTGTEFNKVWDDYSAPRNKLDRFDKLAHNGVPDNKSYYACITVQFSIIAEIADEAVRLIAENNNVVIVGDHGSSRLAALAFHADEGVTPDKTWHVRSHGRFCILPMELAFEEIPADFESVSRQQNGETIYALVSKSYAHFRQSGNAPFETHGGATPEEALVTVLALTRHTPLPKPTVATPHKQGLTANEMGI
jgi:hypothetical protein